MIAFRHSSIPHSVSIHAEVDESNQLTCLEAPHSNYANEYSLLLDIHRHAYGVQPPQLGGCWAPRLGASPKPVIKTLRVDQMLSYLSKLVIIINRGPTSYLATGPSKALTKKGDLCLQFNVHKTCS